MEKQNQLGVRDVIRPTTMIEAKRLESDLNLSLRIASETFQHTGSFKFRAAYHLASNIKDETILTASSGNFGQALAYSCKLLGKKAIVVMPETSSKVKMEGVREHGGIVEPVDTTQKSRAERVDELSAEHPAAAIASAYDDPLVIDGNATLGEELAAYDFDVVVVPIGGGGLSSGIVKGLRSAGNNRTRVIAAEPLLGNDAAHSLKAGHIVRNTQEPLTIADGARTLSLGEHNWAILKDGLEDIVEVPEHHIKEAVRLSFTRANLKAEPTGALSIGALLTKPELFRKRSVCCVVTGGNVEPQLYSRILSGGD